jgi:hypothetical protein
MGLRTEIEARRKEIRTDAYPMSVGEWISLYERDEIDIHPEFQRFFRWTCPASVGNGESVRPLR